MLVPRPEHSSMIVELKSECVGHCSVYMSSPTQNINVSWCRVFTMNYLLWALCKQFAFVEGS